MQLIQELLAYAKDVTNPVAKELASRINEDVVTEWLHADDDVPTIHHYTDFDFFLFFFFYIYIYLYIYIHIH